MLKTLNLIYYIILLATEQYRHQIAKWFDTHATPSSFQGSPILILYFSVSQYYNSTLWLRSKNSVKLYSICDGNVVSNNALYQYYLTLSQFVSASRAPIQFCSKFWYKELRFQRRWSFVWGRYLALESELCFVDCPSPNLALSLFQ